MLRKSFVLLVVGMVVFFLCSVASADVPDSINYQGKLTTASGGCLNDTVQMTFTIYADAFGTVLEWSETQTQVEVKEGIFNVLLGSVNPLAASIFDGSAKYLGVQVESDPEMSPLRPMVTTAYAFHSATADSAFNVPAAGIVSVDGVSNPGGDVDFIQNNSITITPNDGANIITFGETHSARSDNPHVVTAAQTNALVSVDGVSNAGGNVDFIAGTNITITPNDGANTVTFSSTAGGIGGSGTTNYIPKFTASTTLGNSAIYQSGSNVGIGTTNPDSKLHIHGVNDKLTARFTHPHSQGAGKWVGLGFGSDLYNKAGIIFETTLDEPGGWERGSLHLATRNTNNAINVGLADARLTVTRDGNVGIGTTSPAQKLDVAGTAQMTGFKMPTGAGTDKVLTSDASGVGTWQVTPGGIGGSGTTNYIPKFTGSTTIGNSVIYETGGNVGIGDATPDEKFDVNGDAAIYGGICVDDADDCTPPADGHVKADAFDYSTAQTRDYVIGPADFTGGNPDVDDLDIEEDIIWNEGASSTYIYAPVHLPEGATLTSVCVDGHPGVTDTWNLYECDYRSSAAWSIASGNVGDPGCQTFTHTIQALDYYTLRISLGAGNRIDGARIKYTVTVPLP